MPEQWEKVSSALARETPAQQSLYAILDSAREIDIAYRLLNSKDIEYVSLFKGRREEPIWDAAPYLVRCDSDSLFFRWILEKGWGNSWGVFLTSASLLEQLYSHFQQFLLIRTEEDKELYFRFYDPRVLRLFLPTCNPDQISQFFGPISSFLVEGEQSSILVRCTSLGYRQAPVHLVELNV